MTAPTPAAPSPLDHEEIDRLWIEAASEVGLRVERTHAAYAASDGRGAISIGVRESLDVDDSVAQLVFHELCHALVEGGAGWNRPDWGLDNTSERDLVREHACLRVQAHLADAHALRALMIPTTVSRAYYAALPALALTSTEPDPAIALARAAVERASELPWRKPLARALRGTAAFVRGNRRWSPLAEMHPLGFALGPAAERCATCAWSYDGGRGAPGRRCRQGAGSDANGPRVDDDFPACARWEPPVACARCGACCREAYHVVSVRVRDPVVWKQPDLVERDGPRFRVRRQGDRCAALDVTDGATGRAYACRIYDDRPQTCRDFQEGGAHCLSARRRVGLSA